MCTSKCICLYIHLGIPLMYGLIIVYLFVYIHIIVPAITLESGGNAVYCEYQSNSFDT